MNITFLIANNKEVKYNSIEITFENFLEPICLTKGSLNKVCEYIGQKAIELYPDYKIMFTVSGARSVYTTSFSSDYPKRLKVNLNPLLENSWFRYAKRYGFIAEEQYKSMILKNIDSIIKEVVE